MAANDGGLKAAMASGWPLPPVPAPTGTRAAATSAAASANLHGFPRGTSICAADS